MEAGRDNCDELQTMMLDPQAVLDCMDAAGVQRIGMINYVAEKLMGFGAAVNPWVAAIAAAAPERLLPFGGLDPRDPAVESDPAGAVDHLLELGIRGLKIHPPHQELRANAYREGAADEHLPALAGIYARCAERGLPVMIHTGTSIFPGARSRFGNPLECDDVAIDFPDLIQILVHAGRPFWCEQAMFVARRHSNLYLDLSGIPPKRLSTTCPSCRAWPTSVCGAPTGRVRVCPACAQTWNSSWRSTLQTRLASSCCTTCLRGCSRSRGTGGGDPDHCYNLADPSRTGAL